MVIYYDKIFSLYLTLVWKYAIYRMEGQESYILKTLCRNKGDKMTKKDRSLFAFRQLSEKEKQRYYLLAKKQAIVKGASEIILEIVAATIWAQEQNTRNDNSDNSRG